MERNIVYDIGKQKLGEFICFLLQHINLASGHGMNCQPGSVLYL